MASIERQTRARLQKLEKHKNRIKGTNKPKTMPVTEWEFAQSILRRNPNLIVISHPETFSFTDRSGEHRETTPDFLIVNPNNSAANVYVEITLFEKDKLPQNSKKNRKKISLASKDGFDTKARQREVMSNAAPDDRYVVLYADNLRNMQRSDDRFDPWIRDIVTAPAQHSRRNNKRRNR